MAQVKATVVALLLCVVLCLVCAQVHVDNQVRGKRQVQNGTLHRFVSDLHQGQVDLVILIDGSNLVGRYNFYSQSRKLVSHVLRYYTKADPDYVRVAVATFSMDLKVNFDGINNNISKCDIWTTHWDNVLFNETRKNWNISRAVHESTTIFRDSLSNDRSHYIWVVSGNVPSADTLRHVVEATANTTTVLLTSIDDTRTYDDLQYKSVHYIGDVDQTIATFESYGPIQSLHEFQQLNSTHLCHQYGYIMEICKTCRSGELCEDGLVDCVCSTTNTTSVCTVPGEVPHSGYCTWTSGLHGPECRYRDTQCLPGACANNGTCVEDVPGYMCHCLHGYDPTTLCETHADAAALPLWAIAVLVLLIIIIIVIFICIVCEILRRRRRRASPPTLTYGRTIRGEQSDLRWSIYTVTRSIASRVERLLPDRASRARMDNAELGDPRPSDPPPTPTVVPSSSPPHQPSLRDKNLERLQKAEELKGHLKDWLSGSQFASGIDVDDQKLTIFCPKDEEDAMLLSLKTEMEKYRDFHDSYKVKRYSMFSIRRQQSKIGSGSHIYHLDHHGQPLYVTLGAIFKDLIENGLYCLTTSHLEDAKGKNFYFSSNNLLTKLGQCVGYIQQSNPLLEACLIRIDKAAYDQCSPVLLPELLQSPVAFRGPYTGAISELLAAPQEVMLCGGQTDLTRGRMKYYAFDFTDPDTNYKVYGGIVTLPSHPGDFVTEGDSGASISIASSQSFLVKDWCLGVHTTGTHLRRDALPYTSIDQTERQAPDDSTFVVHHSGESQVVPESYENRASAYREVNNSQDQQSALSIPVESITTSTDLEPTCIQIDETTKTLDCRDEKVTLKIDCSRPSSFNSAENQNLDGSDEKTTVKALSSQRSSVSSADIQNPKTPEQVPTTGYQADHGAVFGKEKTRVKIVCSRQSSGSSAENPLREHDQASLKQVQQQESAHDSIIEETLLKTTSASVRQPTISLKEVMTHEAISTHCFSGRIEYEDEPPEYGSISFRMDLAVEKLQEQIGAELRLVPILIK